MSRKIYPQNPGVIQTYYDHFPKGVGYDWRKFTNPTAEDWLCFRQEISAYGCCKENSLMYAIAYLIDHMGGKFPPVSQQPSSFWGRLAQSVYDWYQFAHPVIGPGFALSHDPAVHFRALRFVVISFAGLGARQS